jgi:hypothetical protein
LGDLRFVSITTAKSWETYGIHALEAIYPILGPGFLTAQNTGTKERNVVHLTHECGADIVVVASADMFGGFGCQKVAKNSGFSFNSPHFSALIFQIENINHQLSPHELGDLASRRERGFESLPLRHIVKQSGVDRAARLQMREKGYGALRTQ